MINSLINNYAVPGMNPNATFNKLPPQYANASSQYLWIRQAVVSYPPLPDLNFPSAKNYYWNQMSDRRFAHEPFQNSYADGAYHVSSTRHSITRPRPGATNPGGRGVDVKHGWYGRFYNRLKAPYISPSLCVCTGDPNQFVQATSTEQAPLSLSSSSSPPFTCSQQRILYDDLVSRKIKFYSDSTSAINSSSKRLRSLKEATITDCGECQIPNPRFLFYGSMICKSCSPGTDQHPQTQMQSMKAPGSGF